MDDYRRKDKDAGAQGIVEVCVSEAHTNETSASQLLQHVVLRLVSSAEEAEEKAHEGTKSLGFQYIRTHTYAQTRWQARSFRARLGHL